MAVYKHVLVGLDLSPESAQVMRRVRELLGESDARLSLVHVQEPLSFAYGGDIPMDLGELQVRLEDQARERLQILAQENGFEAAQCHILIGQPAQEMHRFARENAVDLAVVGSYGRHGLTLIFGSTANGVLHGATCDVLAVRINPEQKR
ncbi:MAG: universal stress protein [Gammaproteobacteria bacterium]